MTPAFVLLRSEQEQALPSGVSCRSRQAKATPTGVLRRASASAETCRNPFPKRWGVLPRHHHAESLRAGQ